MPCKVAATPRLSRVSQKAAMADAGKEQAAGPEHRTLHARSHHKQSAGGGMHEAFTSNQQAVGPERRTLPPP